MTDAIKQFARRILGDTEDLPKGWRVDADNWGARRATPADAAYLAETHEVACRACIEGDMVCVMDAATARAIDQGTRTKGDEA